MGIILLCIIIHCLFAASIKNIGHLITQFVVSCDNLIEETSSHLWFTTSMYVTWYYCELHDLIKFLCALNKHIRTIYFSEAPRMKKYFKLGMCLKIAKKKIISCEC